jgi:uncharacterized protein (TIGR03435 family)
VLGALTLRTLGAQIPSTADRVAFEVASVKPNLNDVPEGISLQPTGGVRFTAFRLRTLIAIAYGSLTIQRFDQFIGGAPWLASDRFDIVAKAEGDISTDAQGRRSDRLMAMLRTLLEDRFQVRVHRAIRDMPAFGLARARADGRLGPRIQESSIQCPRFVTGAPLPTINPDGWCGIRAAGGTIIGHSVPATELAANLAGYAVVGRPVVDRTNLPGRYDFQIDYAPSLAEDSDAGPSLFTALKEQLGLMLQPERAALPVIVIDRAERPTPD